MIFRTLTVAMCIWHAFIRIDLKDKIFAKLYVVDKDSKILKLLGYKTIKN